MDFYVVLGVRHGATDAEIRRAYRHLARRFHPDINPGDRTAEARFRQIVEAYETLIDPQRRLLYESGARVPDAQDRRGSGFEGFDFSARGVDHSATFGDLFAEVLSERGRQTGAAERGSDLHQSIELSFEEAMHGGQRPITVTRQEICRTCAGVGRVRGAVHPCGACQGSGAVKSVRGHMVFSRNCPSCGGTGQQRPQVCAPCSGTGQETHTERVVARFPAGIADGDRLRLAGRGNAGLRGGEPGDLYVTVKVAPHPVFQRDGDDLHMVLPVAIHEAALGARIEIPTPEGPARLRVPPGTQSGRQFRLHERGAVSKRNGRRGDLVVEIQLVLPKVIDERSKELLREFARINDESVRTELEDTDSNRRAAKGNRPIDKGPA
jgi:molecular chaperone DnaJ